MTKAVVKMGRPRIEVDWNEFAKLCAIHCTEEEIAYMFDMSIDTLNNRCKEEFDMTFSDIYKKYSSFGKMSLRRKQIAIAMRGDKTMLIWLGKQLLGQKDVGIQINNNINNVNTNKDEKEEHADRMREYLRESIQ